MAERNACGQPFEDRSSGTREFELMRPFVRGKVQVADNAH
jgi:hypothetical protein